MTRAAAVGGATRGPTSSETREILVLRALALGDLLCAVPFLRALRARHPRARISLVGLPWAATFVERFDRYLDALVPFPGWPGIPEVPFDAARTARFLLAAQAQPVDLAVQVHGSGVDVNAFVQLLGARATAGYVLPGRAVPPGAWIPYPGDLPEVRRHLALADALGAGQAADDPTLEWPVRPSDRAELAAALAPERVEPDAYVVVHPGASTPIRRWPPTRFAAVADDLAARGHRVVLTGIADEADTTAAVGRAMRAPALDLAGRLSLGALGALLADARLVVTNDTGVGHLAEAAGTSTVRIFRASDPRRWGPLDATRHLALVPPGLGDRCARAAEPGHPDCRAAGCLAGGADPEPSRTLVPVEAALDAVGRLLAQPTGRVA